MVVVPDFADGGTAGKVDDILTRLSAYRTSSMRAMMVDAKLSSTRE